LTEELRRNTERLNAEKDAQRDSLTQQLRETTERLTDGHNTMETDLQG